MTTRTWLITGVSSGIGREVAGQLLARGERVRGAVRDAGSVGDLVAEYGDLFSVAVLDLEDTASIGPVVDRAFAELGRIDVVVSNAGYGLFGAAEELSDAQMRRQIDVNLVGSIQLIRSCLPHLRAQKGGRILQLSSLAGQVGVPCMSIYSATKWGVEGFVEGLSHEVAPFGIELTLIEPGGVPTRFGTASAVFADEIEAYGPTAAGHIRRAVLAGPTLLADPARMAGAIIASADLSPAPLRLALGSDSYKAIHGALTARMETLEANKATTFSTDAAAPSA